MTKKELLKELDKFEDEDAVVICADEKNGWDNILSVKQLGSSIAIVFGGGPVFTD